MDAAALASHYGRFRVGERVLLTGHSHQAWPDVAFEAQQRAWLDAAEHVDDKWTRAFAVADRVREGFCRLLDDPDGDVALGHNTHELVSRFLSALPLRDRPRLVTTDGEFHTIRRQLARLEEEGIEVVRVAAEGGPRGAPARHSLRRPARKSRAARGSGPDLAGALAKAVTDRTAAVLVSSVLFRDATIVEGLDRVAGACARTGAEMLVDAYHALNAVPFSVAESGLHRAFVVGGGYKYCQLGEGACFLRVPPHCRLRPVLTGWFAEFDERTETVGQRFERGAAPAKTRYGQGHLRFAGATYDPTSHYRAARVFDFFREQRLDPERLRAISLAQVRRLAAGIDALDADPSALDRDRAVPLDRKGGFLALAAPRAGEFVRALRARGVWADHRGAALRLGPAPYVTDSQLDRAVAAIGEVARSFGRAHAPAMPRGTAGQDGRARTWPLD